jgi:hypothetical protein
MATQHPADYTGQPRAPSRITPGSLCAPVGPRLRAGHGPHDPVSYFRTLLHHQRRRQRNRTGIGHGLRHRQTKPGVHLCRQHTRRGLNLRPLLSVGRGAAACCCAGTRHPVHTAGGRPSCWSKISMPSGCCSPRPCPITATPCWKPPADRKRSASSPPPAPPFIFCYGRRDAADDRTGLGRAPASAMARATGALYVGICRGKRVTDVSRGTGHRLHPEAFPPH